MNKCQTQVQLSDWTSTAGHFTDQLPRLAFPLQAVMPAVYVPQSTILRMSDGSQTHCAAPGYP